MYHLTRKTKQMMKINEVIVVEGRDDTCAVKRAVDAETIETHGYGITAATWRLIDRAYGTCGIIVFTDPDSAGERIRKKLMAKYPDAKEAFLTRKEASKDGDIGIENARPEDIEAALLKVCCASASEGDDTFDMSDMIENGLTGEGSKEKRQALGRILGIGYGNTGAFLRKLNRYGITREQFFRGISNETIFGTDNKRNQGQA